MPIYTLKLQAKRDIARNTILFAFEKPPNFTFIPGQYGGFTLTTPAAGQPGSNTRRFSLLCSPNDTTINIGTRIQPSSFKNALLELPIGGDIKFAGPTGNFILHSDATVPAVLIAGGIGIAPFYSMIKHATETKSPQPIYLFYGNNTLQDAALIDELNGFAKQNPNLTLIHVLAHPEADWQGETGYITHTVIKKYIRDLNQPIYYVCGAPAMVTALQETLVEMDIDEDRIKVEDFPGY